MSQKSETLLRAGYPPYTSEELAQIMTKPNPQTPSPTKKNRIKPKKRFFSRTRTLSST